MNLQTSYSTIQKRIKKACEECRRDPKSIRLIVASKAQSAERIGELHKLGQIHFGENYAQELFDKAEFLPKSIEWSYIGHLQSNKIKRIVNYAQEIQSLASLKHAELIARHAQELGKAPYRVYIEVQVPGDESKDGVPWNEVLSFSQTLRKNFPEKLLVEGVMAIPPQSFAKHWNEEAESLYKNLRLLANSIGAGKLSLGMSQDLEHAIKCGTDIIRVGSAIMGARK